MTANTPNTDADDTVEHDEDWVYGQLFIQGENCLGIHVMSGSFEGTDQGITNFGNFSADDYVSVQANRVQRYTCIQGGVNAFIATNIVAWTPPTIRVPGSYTKTADNIQFTSDAGGGGTLSADCSTVNGSTNHSVLVYDVANMNGVLTVLPSGSYQQTARNIYLEIGAVGAYLVADCQKIDGSWVQSKLRLGDIANMDGVLTRG